jgi:Plasmid encoded RepA protein
MKSAGHELDAQRHRILKDYLLRNGFIHYVALSREESEPFVIDKAFYGQTFDDDFYREITSHPIPTDLKAVKVLSGAPAALDLFMWLSYRCFVAVGRESIPLFGEKGLANQLGSAEYSRPLRFCQKLEQWLTMIRVLWPDCPARGRRGYRFLDAMRCFHSFAGSLCS